MTKMPFQDIWSHTTAALCFLLSNDLRQPPPLLLGIALAPRRRELQGTHFLAPVILQDSHKYSIRALQSYHYHAANRGK